MGSPFFAPAAAPAAAAPATNPAQLQRQKFASVLGTTVFSYREKTGSAAFAGSVHCSVGGHKSWGIGMRVRVKAVVRKNCGWGNGKFEGSE